MKGCRHSDTCKYFCAVTDSCDYYLETGKRRPCPADKCPGYKKENKKSSVGMVFRNSWIYDEDGNPVMRYADKSIDKGTL